MWEEHIDPGQRGDAIRFVVDALGHVRVLWRDGVLERHPDLRLGIVELSAVWVPST